MSSSVVAISLRIIGSSSTIRIVRVTSHRLAQRARTRSSGIASNAATTVGSNCVPGSRRISSRARSQLDAGPVGPVGRQRVERVGDREHPRGERDLVAGAGRPGSPCRPSARGGGARRACPRRGSRRRAGSPRRRLDAGAISAYSSSVSGLVLNRIASGIADLADVVQQEAELDLRRVLERRARPRGRAPCP